MQSLGLWNMADCVDDLLFVRNKISFEGSVNLNLLQVLKCWKSLQCDVGHIITGMGSVSRHYNTWTPGRDLGAVSNLSVPAVFLKLPNACCVLTLILPNYSLPPPHYVSNAHWSIIKSWGRSWEARKLFICILHLVLLQLLRIERDSYSYSTFFSL